MIMKAQKGSEAGYEYYQGLVEFIHVKSPKQVKNRFGKGAHREKAKGGMEADLEYCSKQNDIR
jgi:hypothetical protein